MRSCLDRTQHSAGHWVCAPRLSEIGNCITVMETAGWVDKMMDRHLQCWAKGVGGRSCLFSSDLAPWVTPEEPGECSFQPCFDAHVCPKDLRRKRTLVFKWESYSSPLKKQVTQHQAFPIVLVSVYCAVYTRWIPCAWLGAPGRQLARGKVQSLLQEHGFCLWSWQVQG